MAGFEGRVAQDSGRLRYVAQASRLVVVFPVMVASCGPQTCPKHRAP